MSRRRAVLTFIICAVVLLSASCTRSVSRQPQVSTPAPPATAGVVASQDKYPDTLEGLQSLMNDMLSATKRGDAKTLDALVKRTEFADYERYFVSTYSPDPLAGEDWAITYRRWLKDNEDNLRELLGDLAKDEGAKILVRKASDDPTRGKGFEWAMVHYARKPVNVYCVSLVFSHSEDGPRESIGYYVYADGMFRWDSIVPFAAPGTYQTVPVRLNETQKAEVHSEPHYANTPEGLRRFLSELREAMKSGDRTKVDSMIKQTEIPEYRNWFCSVYIPGSGLSWAIPYGKGLPQKEQSFKAMWEKFALDDGEVVVRKLVDEPGDKRGIEWGMIHNSRTPLDIYNADWKSRVAPSSEWIGYFIYIDDMFRLDSTVYQVPVVRSTSAPNL